MELGTLREQLSSTTSTNCSGSNHEIVRPGLRYDYAHNLGRKSNRLGLTTAETREPMVRIKISIKYCVEPYHLGKANGYIYRFDVALNRGQTIRRARRSCKFTSLFLLRMECLAKILNGGKSNC